MRNESSFVPFLAGFGAGALFAALLDPRRGAGRRALIRDKALSLVRQAGVTAARQGRDLKQRAQGLAHEVSARIEEEQPSDDVLAERVRAQIGRPVSHPRSIEVRVEGGEVILSGPILRRELDDLLRRVARVRGVCGIRNELEVHESEGSVPGLQSGSPGPSGQSRR